MGSYPNYGFILLLILILPWKFLFLFILTLGSFVAISASSWFIAWIGLEINILALLALFLSNPSSRNSEATLKYFLVQALASAILISRALTTRNLFSFLSSLNLFSIFIIISLLIKIGAAPFHLWVPQIIEGLSWINNSILITWQKIAPFFLLSACIERKYNISIIIISIILSSVLGAMIGLTHISVRKILAFSSINHLGWMLASLIVNLKLWICYFFSYCIILLSLINILNLLNIVRINNTRLNNPLRQISLFITLLSFGGLPPLFGFFPKWITIQAMVDSSITILTILVFSSLVALFFYCRIMFSRLLKKSFLIKPKNYPQKGLVFSLFINLRGIALFPVLFSM